jgi:hypothetical protein
MAIVRSGACFRALYEGLGLTQADVGRILGLSDVKRVRERVHGRKEIRADEWSRIERLRDRAECQAQRIAAEYGGCDHITLPYDTGNTWEARLRNYAVRLAAQELSDAGSRVHFELRHPDRRIR